MKEIEFKKSIDDMTEAELRATFRDFKGNYSDARDDYTELENKVEEYKEDLEEAESKAEIVEDVKPTFCSMFAEAKDLDEEMVEDKFSVDELVDELEDMDAFSLSVDDLNDDDDSTFSEKEQKSRPPEDKDKSKFQDRIDAFMSGRVIEHDNY